MRDFLPWVRIGLASAMATPDDGASVHPANVDLPVAMSVNTSPFTVSVTAYGPGDAVSIDPRQVIRTEPVDGCADFEPNYFAAIEFHRPDLPWLFTPLGGKDQLQIRPWISLVVVEAGGPASLQKNSTDALAVLHLPDRSELPDLSESCFWAHAQVTARSSDNGLDLVTSASDQALSRLVCPRRLKPDTAYVACVVPTFEAGRQSALRLQVSTTDLTPSWSATSAGAICLPVFYSWRFSTGSEGDFESLLQGIIANSPPTVPGGFGLRDLNVTALKYSIPDLGVVQLGTALTLVPAPPPPPQLPAAFTDAFAAMLALTVNDHVPVVGPPVYGSWYTSRLPPTTPGWLRDLNLDPRRRAIAALGVLVVHNQQEQLMASAWDQLAGIQDGNQALRHAQLAREVSTAVHTNRFADRDPGPLIQSTQPVHGRVPVIQTTFAAEIAQSSLPDTVLTAAFRRLTRPQGPIARRFRLSSKQPSQFVAGLVSDLLHLALAWTKPDGTVSMLDVDKAAGLAQPYPDLPMATPAAIQGAPGWKPRATSPPATTDVQWAVDAADQQIPQPPRYGDLSAADLATMIGNFRQAAQYSQQHFLNSLTANQASRPGLPIDEIHKHLLDRLHPQNTVTDAARNRIQVDSKVWDRPDPLQPITDVPKFPYPMSQTLADLSQDLLLSGLDLLPPESAAMLAPDYGFVEAFMVGANQAMLQELLWRGFPTHQLGTCFNQFWATAESAEHGDIPPIQSWVTQDPLGDNSKAWSTEPLVLAIRSSIFRRYPHTSVYAVKAVKDGAGSRTVGTGEIYPILSAFFDPDIRLFGFALTPDQAIGKADGLGWYFVLAEHPTAPRFGLEPASPPGFKADPSDWSAVSWANLVDDQSGLDQLVCAPAAWRDNTSLTLPLSPPPGTPTLTWGKAGSDSAQMAAITVRQPLRVAIHASALLPASK